jgi:hypothetical protein
MGVAKTIGKIIFFPVYVPYKLIKDATTSKLPEEFEAEIKGETAQHFMSYGFKPDDAFKLSEEFWKKNKNKLLEAVRL